MHGWHIDDILWWFSSYLQQITGKMCKLATGLKIYSLIWCDWISHKLLFRKTGIAIKIGGVCRGGGSALQRSGVALFWANNKWWHYCWLSLGLHSYVLSLGLLWRCPEKQTSTYRPSIRRSLMRSRSQGKTISSGGLISLTDASVLLGTNYQPPQSEICKLTNASAFHY